MRLNRIVASGVLPRIFQLRKPHFGIAAVFAVALALFATAAVVIVSALQIQRERDNFSAASTTAAVSLTETLAPFFADTMTASGNALLPSIVEFLGNQPQIARIRILDPQGEILATAGGGPFAADSASVLLLLDSAEPVVTTRGDTTEVYGTIRSADRTWGVLQFAITLGQDDALEDAIVQIIWQAALLVLAGIVLAVLLARYITAPLRRLAAAAHRISEGDLAFSIATARRDELGTLANAFEEMRSGIESARAEVQAATRDLESAVEQRMGAERAVKSRAEVDRVLAEIGKLMTSALEIEDVYERFAELTGRLLPFDRVAVANIDLEARTMTTTYEAGVHIPAWGPGQTRRLFPALGQTILESPGAILVDKEIAEWAVTEYPEMQDVLDAGLLSTLAVPIFYHDRAIAFMALNSRDPAAYTADDAELAEQIVGQIAGVIANVNLRTELQREVEVRSTQAEIGRLVSSWTEPGEMYRTLADLIRGLIPFDRIVIASLDQETTEVSFEYVAGLEFPERFAGDVAPVRDTAVRLVVDARATVRMEAEPGDREDVRPMEGFARSHGLRSIVMTPLFSQGLIVGVISLNSLRDDAFTDDDVELLERIAAQVGGAIGAAQLNARIQAESQQRLHRLEDLDSLRLQFLQMVTHEFRTPLASLRVSRDLLAESSLEDLQRDAYSRLITNMGRGVDRLDTLVTDLLDLTIAQAGELNLNLGQVDIRDLLEDSVEIVSPLGSQRNQTFTIAVEQPAPVVLIDRRRIEQVLLNLLSNAHKYSDDDVEITVESRRVDSSVEIRVTGRGPDIPEQDRPHMFEPFFRGTGPATRATPGRGLGLSIAKAFVELHGGTIGFDSIPDRGPSFYFRLPTND